MEIKQLTKEHAKAFSKLIIDMYSHLENLEWFTPMPYDLESVENMIQKERFYIIGAFNGNTLMGVSSLDYKCGKLIGKIDFPEECNTESLVEIGFNIVGSKFRGKGIMKQMVSYLLEKIKKDNFEWVFAKVHEDNFASSVSLEKNGFEKKMKYQKPVDAKSFKELSSQNFFSDIGKQNAEKTLSKLESEDNEIIVDYNILIKKV